VSFEVGFRKPAPAFFHTMCRKTGMPAAQILYVGDDPDNDYAGAEAAGMAAVLFDPREKHEDWGGARIRTLDEMATLLDRV
jgi:putative hydrolase of the HAD superfamily